MALYLRNLLRAGGRPLMREAGPALPFGPRVLSVERVATPEATRETFAKPAAEPSMATMPVNVPTDQGSHSKVLPPEREREPNHAIPVAEIHLSATLPPSEEVESAPVRETIQSKRQSAPASQPLPVAAAPAVLPTALELLAALPTAPARDVPRQSEAPPAASSRPAERLIPAPRHVETVRTEASAALTGKLLGHQDLRLPRRSNPPVAPRVEFIAAESIQRSRRTVDVLQRPQRVTGEETSSKPEPRRATLFENASRADAMRTAPLREPQMPAASSSTEPVPAPPTPIRETALRREPPTSQPQRKESESTIEIKRIDIQIVNEEKRKTARTRRTAPQAEESAGRRFDRQYMREVM